MPRAQAGMAPLRMSNEALRAEHDAVLSSLATRGSTKHFANAAVSVFFSLMLGGTTAKLWWDGQRPDWTMAAGASTALVLGYAAVRVALGVLAHKKERVQLTRLRALRASLGVDAPASFTPGVS